MVGMSKILQCVNCNSRTTDYEAEDRVLNPYNCGLCGGPLREVPDGKSQDWRDKADLVLKRVALWHEFLVSDILIMYLEAAGLGLDDYSPLGGVFKRAAADGIITKVDRDTKQSLWHSNICKNKMLVEVTSA